MHHDTERTVVGVGIEGVDVGHLRGGQKREQNQADNRCGAA